MKLIKEVDDFLDSCARAVGKHASEWFQIETFQEISEYSMDSKNHTTMRESPIEQLLYCAFKTVLRLQEIEHNQIPIEKDHIDVGIEILPQFWIDRYRVDFLLRQHSGSGQILNKIIIECDSQEFHERTEKERRYEKCRDRYFASQKITVLHFTGKEIKENPIRVACEALTHLDQTRWYSREADPTAALYDALVEYF